MNAKNAITWDDLANEYDKCNSGRAARTMAMDKVLDWARRRVDKFVFDKDGYVYFAENYKTSK